MPVPTTRLEALTSLRFVAALMVFAWHAPLFAHLLRPYGVGYYGVAFFFALSGFIIGLSYADRLRLPNRRASWRFYRARLAKIYPLHLLTLVIAIGLVAGVHIATGASTQAAPWQTLAMNLLLIQPFWPDTDLVFSYNTVAWSLSAELFFYALTPLLIPGVWQLRRRAGWKAVILPLAGLWITYLVIASGLSVRSEAWGLYLFPPVRMFEYAAGLCLGLWFYELRRKSAAVPHATPAGHRRVSRVGPTVLEVLVLAFTAGGIALNALLPMSLRFGVFLLPFTLGLLLVFAFGRGHISRILSHRTLVWLGAASFAFYMLHQLVIRFVDLWLDGRALVTWTALAITLPACGLAYHFFEEPARRRLAPAPVKTGNKP